MAKALDSGDRPSPHFHPGLGDWVSLKLGAGLNFGSAFSDPRDGDVLRLRTKRAGACMMRCIVDMVREETAGSGKRPGPGAREAENVVRLLASAYVVRPSLLKTLLRELMTPMAAAAVPAFRHTITGADVRQKCTSGLPSPS